MIRVLGYSIYILCCIIGWRKAEAYDIPVSCFICLCSPITDCRVQKSCQKINGELMCGIYKITKSYWEEAISSISATELRTYNRSILDFEACCTDPVCADIILQLYITKHITDCNSDGVIDCKDVYRTHTKGPNECQSLDKKEENGWEKLISCLRISENVVINEPVESVNPMNSAIANIEVSTYKPPYGKPAYYPPQSPPNFNRPWMIPSPTRPITRIKPYNKRRPPAKPPVFDDEEDNPYG